MDNVRLGNFTSPRPRRFEGRSLGEISRSRDADVVDTMCDLLTEEDLGVNEVAPGP